MKRRTFLAGFVATMAASQVRGQNGTIPADGATNALPSIQKLLVEAEKKGGGTIRLPEGRLLLRWDGKGAAITLPASVRLEGAGIDKTTIVMAGDAKGNVINAPYGYAQIVDLTVDGNAAARAATDNHVGGLGVNIRLEADNCTVERVRSINAAGYGIAVGQKRYARNIILRDVEVINSGQDGIDFKNDLLRTDNILLERITVRGFARLDGLSQAMSGTEADARGNKAGVDLRGSNCVVRQLTILGVQKGRAGLRFRAGEVNSRHGPGAHGGIAQGIVIRGLPGKSEGNGISVDADGVRLQDVDIEGVQVGIHLSADDLEVKNGRVFASMPIAIKEVHNKKRDQTANLRCENIAFGGCAKSIRSTLERDSRFALKNCTFDRSCT